MKSKRFIGFIALVLCLTVGISKQTSAESARDRVVNYASMIQTHKWYTNGYILMYTKGVSKDGNGTLNFTSSSYETTPVVATGYVKGIPYSLAVNGGSNNGVENTFNEYHGCSDNDRLIVAPNTYSNGRLSMYHGASCATFVWNCLSQALPNLPREANCGNLTGYYASKWSNYISPTYYNELQKGDILLNNNHIMLVVDNDGSQVEVIHQTTRNYKYMRCPNRTTRTISFQDIPGTYEVEVLCMRDDCSACNAYTMGTSREWKSYSDVSSYTPYHVNYGDDTPDLSWNGSTILQTREDSPIKVYTLENRTYSVYYDKYLKNAYSSNIAYTNGSEEDRILNVGKNSEGVDYAYISIPRDNGERRSVYVNLRDVFVKGSLNEPTTVYKECRDFYRRRNGDYDNSYILEANDTVYPLTRDNGWIQICFWDVGNNGGSRIAWLTNEKWEEIIKKPDEKPEIITDSLEKAVVGNYYSQTLSATGTTPIAWEISGTLPPGLSFNKSTGRIYGTPTSTTNSKNAMYDTYRFDVIASNAAGSDRKTLGILLYETPSITTDMKLPDAYLNEEYGVEISATGSAFGMRWSLKNGSSLPSGLQFEKSNSNRIAKITGKPAVTGTFSFTLQLQSIQISKTVERTFQLTVYETSKLEIVPSTIPEAIVGKPYTANLKFKGGEISTLTAHPTNLFYGQGREFDCLYNGSDIKITGTPRSARNETITINACNSDYTNLREIFQKFTLKVIEPAIEGTLKNGTAMQPYNSSFSANWPSTSYNWSRSGTLPSGLSVSYSGANATISGTPTSTGTFSFSLTVKDADNFSVTRDFNLTIAMIPSISGTFSNGTTGNSYTGTVNVTGGISPYTWSFSGSLPNGILPTYSGAKATISGTTQQTGTYSFTLKVEDANGASATKEFKNISFYKNPTINGVFDEYTMIGNSYYSFVSVSNGNTIDNWTIVDGSLPKGLELSFPNTLKRNVLLSGQPEVSGEYKFKLRVTDKDGRTDTKAFNISVAERMDMIGYFNDSTEGFNYSGSVKVTGGFAPYTWLDGENCPSGLNFIFSGDTAYLTGKPTQAGNYQFRLGVKDNAGSTIYKDFFITIASGGLQINSTNFPDSIFRSYVSSNFDKDGSGYLSNTEIASIKVIDVSNKNIANLKGIEFFTALEELICDGNKLSVLDVSKNTALKTLHCSKNSLTSLNLSNNKLLENVECDNNKLTALDVSKNLKLDYLSCSGNSIVKLDVSNNTSLKWLYCNGNQLTELILGNNSVLQEVSCEGNSSLTILDIQGCPKLLSNNNILADTTLALFTGENLPEFGNSTLVLDGKIGINFYVYIPETYNPEECYMVFESRRGISNENQNEKYNPELYSMRNGKKYYAYTCYINSAQMAEEVTATFYFNGKIITKKDSVDAYLNRAKEHESELSDNVNNLMKAIRNYGHYVQPMLAINGHWNIGDRYIEMPKASEITNSDIEEAKTSLAQYAKVEYQNSIGIEKNNFSLNLDTETIINVYSMPSSTYKGTVSVTVDGQKYEAIEDYSSGSLRYKTEIKNIKAPDLNKTYSVFVEANGINMIQVSALSYAQAVLNANLSTIGNVPIDIMKQAVTALYKYHATSKAYMDGGKK